MTVEAIDPGIVGPAYTAPMLLQDAENAINWYVEVAETDGAKEAIALLGTPGLQSLINFPQLFVGLTPGPVRGLWVLPGNTQILAVVSNLLFLGTLSVAATQTSIPTFKWTTILTLLTNTGPVAIRDNGLVFGGLGGFALIVDGLYAYYYALNGAGYSVTFTGATTAGSPNITLPSALPNGLLIGQGVVTGATGFTSGQIASINYNAPAIVMASNATVTSASATFTFFSGVSGQLTDPGLPVNPTRLAFIEGFLIASSAGSRTFQTTGPTAYSMLFPPSFYSLKDSSTDNLVALEENNRELWLVGERTSEVWYNAGGATFPFARVPGVGPQIGCSAPFSLTRAGSNLYWVARNEQGENMIVRNNQYSWERVSNHAVDFALSQYNIVSDCIGYSYEEAGHLFVVFLFPTADSCWVYDATASANAKQSMWHQRLSYNSTTGQFHRHLSNCFANFQDLRLVGDYQSSIIYIMSRGYYTDNGAVLKCQRRNRHVWAKASRQRLFHSSLQIEFTPGVGLQSGQGSDPQVMVRWSDDGAFTWSNEHWATIGKAGQTKNRAKLNRLGATRDRVYEVNFTDPVPRDIIGATLFVEQETA